MTDNPRAHLIHHFAEDLLFRSDCDVRYFYLALEALSNLSLEDLFSAMNYGISVAACHVINSPLEREN